MPGALQLILGVILLWLALGVAGVFFPRNLHLVSRVLFPAGAVGALALAAAALDALGGNTQSLLLPLGLPDLPFHVRLDALSAFFLLLLGAVTAGILVFAAGYFRRGEGTPPGLQCLYYHVFIASMALVLLADDAYAFMVFCETMALSSYFLVTSDHTKAEIRRAGFLYLLIAHVGAIGILLCFGLLHGTGDYTFDTMRTVQLAPFWATVAFALALFGFGAKAGMLPLHVWLPEAHPAAPSPVSALMSAVMLKTAIYGLLRILFDLLHMQVWWWGAVILALGLATALYGVVFSAVQSDMKRLLAGSLAIRHVDAGSCNGCELEIHMLNNPYYNIEGLGIKLVASPRHADLLLVTGPVSRNMEVALQRSFDAMPAPKLVVAVGDCGCSGGIFGESYASCGRVSNVIAVDVAVPGCPPTPTALLQGILTAISSGRHGAA